MFASTFHNGEYGLEIFSPSGNEPFKSCKLNNEQNIRKVYDRTIKGYMVAMEKESSTTSIQFPKSYKGSLMITQPLLVLQIQLDPSRSFSIELIVIDTEQQRRRFHLSTNFKDVAVNSLHACLPWPQPDREQWTNVALNLEQLVCTFYTGKATPTFFNLESITIQPVCRIRKIFSLPLKYLGDEATGLLIPPKFDFTTGVAATSWVYAADGGAVPPVTARSEPPAEEAGMLGVVGKKVPRREEAPSVPQPKVSSGAGAGDADNAAAKRQKGNNPWDSPASASAKDISAPSASAVPPLSLPDPGAPVVAEAKVAPIVFSGRLRQKLGAATATAPVAPHLPAAGAPAAALLGSEGTTASAGEHDDSSMDQDQDESSFVEQDTSALTEGGAQGGGDLAQPSAPPVSEGVPAELLLAQEEGDGRDETTAALSSPPSEHSAEASSLTATDASVIHGGGGGEGELGSPTATAGAEDVLGRYLQLRQSGKLNGEPPVGAGAGVTSGVVGPSELLQSRQSVHDYSLVEEYVSSYRLHQKLQHVRESQYVAAEEQALRALGERAGAAMEGDDRAGIGLGLGLGLGPWGGERGIAADVPVQSQDWEGEGGASEVRQEGSDDHADLEEGLQPDAALVEAGDGDGLPPLGPTAAPRSPVAPAPAVRARTFVDAAVSPMPSMDRELVARPYRGSSRDAVSVQSAATEGEGTAVAAEDERTISGVGEGVVSPTVTSDGASPVRAPTATAVEPRIIIGSDGVGAADEVSRSTDTGAGQDQHDYAETEGKPTTQSTSTDVNAMPDLVLSPVVANSPASTPIPAHRIQSAVEGTTDDEHRSSEAAQSSVRASAAQQLLSPFSEAVAFIENSGKNSARSSRHSQAGASASNSVSGSVTSRLSGPRPATAEEGRVTTMTTDRPHSSISAASTDRENLHPNTSADPSSDYAVYQAKSAALAERYTRSIDAIVEKLEQRGGATAKGLRSPLQPSRPGTALSGGAPARSGGSLTAALGSSTGGAEGMTEQRKAAIKARVALLLRQLAQAELEYIAEFGFEAFEAEVGFFEDNVPLRRH